MYSLLFDYLISIISFARELTLLAYILVIVLLWRSILVLASDLAILDICFSPGHRTPIARGRQADEGLTESLLQVRRVIT
jgi:hypothetical protein